MAGKRKKSSRCTRCLRRYVSLGNLELRDINLLQQAAAVHPGRNWHDLPVCEQAEVFRQALLPENLLIDPHCAYMRAWDTLVAACLIYVGIVTPYEVIFIGPLDIDSWLFLYNRIVDAIFIKDILLQFFVKFELFDHGRRGRVLVKDPWLIRRRYLTTWFPIDLIGVMQFDLWFILLEDATSIAPIKFLRMVRLLRLIKLLRMLRTSRLVARWQNFFNVSFAVQKLTKLIFGLLTCSHWMACFWGLLGYALGRELCDRDGNRLIFEEPPRPSEVSWLTVLFEEDRLSPDDPCNSWHVYSSALHWAVLTITSIGYGDIVPTRNAEYWGGVFCMLLGGVVWATVIGGMCAVIGSSDPVQEKYEINTDLLNRMMGDCGVPPKTQSLYREYLREAKVHDAADHFRKLAQQFSPGLRGRLLLQVSRNWMDKVPYLTKASERCAMHLVDGLNLRFFGRREILDISSDNLCITDRGSVARDGQLVTPGQVFHVDFIVCLPRLRKLQETVSLTYCLILTLHRDVFFHVIEGQPELKAEAKRMAVAYAMTRCVKLCVEEHRRERGIAPAATPLSFVDAFDRLQIDQTQYNYAARGGDGDFERIVNLPRANGSEKMPRPKRGSNQESPRTGASDLYKVSEAVVSQARSRQRSPPSSQSSPASKQPAPQRSGALAGPDDTDDDGYGNRLEVLETTVETVLGEIKRLRKMHAKRQADESHTVRHVHC